MADRHATSRRQWLAACAGGTAGISGLAGCVDGGDGNGDDGGGPLGGDGDGDSGEDGYERLPGWPMYAADHRSSGWNPDTTGPTGEVQERWSQEYNTPVAASGAPVIADGTLYVGREDGVFMAFDVESGEELWTHQFEGWRETVSYSAVVVDDTVYVPWSEAVAALDVSDGSQRWAIEHDLRPYQLQYYDDAIYTTVGYPGADNARILRYDPNDRTREVVHEFDLERISKTLAIAAGTAYVAVADSVVAIDLESGEEEWRWTHPEGDPTSHAGVTVSDGMVFATTSLYARQNELPGCFGIDAESGDEEWRFTPDTSELRSPPAVADGVVYVGEHDLWAIDAESGEEEWTAEDVVSYSKPTVVDGTVYSWGDEVYGVDVADGTVEWTFSAQRSDVLDQPPVSVHDGIVGLAYLYNVAVLETV